MALPRREKAVAVERAAAPWARRAFVVPVAALLVLGAPSAATAEPPAPAAPLAAGAIDSLPAATRRAELLLALRFGRGNGVPQSYANAGAWVTGKGRSDEWRDERCGAECAEKVAACLVCHASTYRTETELASDQRATSRANAAGRR